VLQIARALHGHTHAMWSDFWPSFVAVGLFSFLSIPVTRRLAPHAGDEIARGSRG
jgi:hypothetical protein